MKVFSIDVKIVATAYIRAATEEDALRIFSNNFSQGLGGELPTSDRSESMEDIEVSGRQYDDPDLPECSLSPAISFYGPASEDGSIELDLVEEVEEDEGEEGDR